MLQHSISEDCSTASLCDMTYLKASLDVEKGSFIIQKHTNRFLLFGDNDFHLNTNFDMEKHHLY